MNAEKSTEGQPQVATSAVVCDEMPVPMRQYVAIVTAIIELIKANQFTEINEAMVQRRLRVGYTPTSNALDELTQRGVLGERAQNNRWMRQVVLNAKDHSPIGAVGASNTEPNSAAPIG